MEDAALVERARHGDAAAFGELVDRHRVAVYRAVRAALRSSGEAEDVAQEAFLTAYRKLESFRGEASFKTWILSIAWRKALDRRRRLAARLRRFVASEHVDSAASSPEPAAERTVITAERLAQVQRLITRLPARLRDPLLLAATGEHTLEEVGAILDMPVGSVKWRVSEARKRLREKLERLGYGRE